MTSTETKHQPEVKDGYPFGYGRYYKLEPTDTTAEAIQEEAFRLGWSNGCPRARFYVLESTYGADWMMRRYAETNLWFVLATNSVHHRFNNPQLYNMLALSKARLPDEPVGVYEELSVPRSHLIRISPMSAIEGYSTPRILLEIPEETRIEALRRAVILTGKEPSHFLAHLSQVTLDHGASPEKVLHHVYAQGVLEEENCRSAYRDLAESLERFAPTVWNTYIQLPQSQRLELAIAEIPA